MSQNLTSRIFTAQSFLLFLMGSVVQIFSYASIQPLIIGVLTFFLGFILVYLFIPGKKYEYSAYNLVFSMGWFWAGIAAIYANQLQDPHQLLSDSSSFFNLSSGLAQGITLEDIVLITDGAGAVVLWRAIYDFFASIGFEKGRYIGIAVNIFFVSISSVVGLKIVRLIFGDDEPRLKRWILISSSSGMFWLFAAIHLRDSIILLIVTTLIYFWIRYFEKIKLINLLIVIIATVISLGLFLVLRNEFILVPLIIATVGIFARQLQRIGTKKNKLLNYGVIILVIMILIGVIFYFADSVTSVVDKGSQDYGLLANSTSSESGESSLGLTLIVNTPTPIRMLVAPPYLLLSPIPVTFGFQLTSIYYLFKSLHTIQLYFVIPLLLLASYRLITIRKLRSASLLFLILCSYGFIVAISMTSLESRHLGVFLVPVFIICLLPDLTYPKEKRVYRTLLGIVVSCIAVIHLTWLIIQFV